MQRFPGAFALAAVIALTACSQAPQGGQRAPSVAGKVVSPYPDFMPQAASLLMVDSASLDTSAVNQVAPGVYTAGAAAIAADGSFELVLPKADELPAAVLVPANDLLKFGSASCTLTVSAAGARVSQYYSEGLTILVPGVVFLSFLGPTFSLTTTAPFDITDPGASVYDHELVSWLFATEDVAVASGELGCDVDGTPFTIDLDLKVGWNQVALGFELDPDTDAVIGAKLSNNDADELYFNVVGPG